MSEHRATYGSDGGLEARAALERAGAGAVVEAGGGRRAPVLTQRRSPTW